MTFATGLTTAKDRILQMELNAVSGSVSASYASFSGTYNNLYWVNYLGAIGVTKDGSNEFRYAVPLIARLTTGFITENFQGRLEGLLTYTHIPIALEYFLSRERLQIESSDIPPDHLVSCVVTCSGTRIFTSADGANRTFGTEFTFNMVFENQIKRTW